MSIQTSHVDMHIDLDADTSIDDQVNAYRSEVADVLRNGASEHLTVPAPERFTGQDGQTREYVAAPDLADRAAVLIARYPELAHIAGLEVRYLWRGKGGAKGGKNVLGKCSKISGAARYFSAEETGVPADVMIWLAADHHIDAPDRIIEAHLYHELLHIGWDDQNDKLLIEPHDFEGFGREIERYGLHTEDLRYAGQVLRQLPLIGGA